MVFDLSAPKDHGEASTSRRTSTHSGVLVQGSPVASAEDVEFRAMAAAAERRETRRATFGYGLHSTALQIKDQARSIRFYTQVLGMEVAKETESE